MLVYILLVLQEACVYQLVLTFVPVLVAVKHPEAPAQVILVTVGVTTIVGVLLFCVILKVIVLMAEVLLFFA